MKEPRANALVQPDLNVRRALGRAVFLPLLLTVVVAGSFFHQTRALLGLSGWVDHTDQVIGLVNRLQTRVVEMESGMRGYLLMNDEKFISSFGDFEHLDAEFGNLKDLVKWKAQSGNGPFCAV